MIRHALRAELGQPSGTGRDTRLKLAVVSHVLPFPRTAGQNQRVHYTLQAARERFDVTFVTTAPPSCVERTRRELLQTCDEAIVLPSRYLRNRGAHALLRTGGAVFAARTGLKLSNYVIGSIDYTPARIAPVLRSLSPDCVLFEYWHAADVAASVRDLCMPTVLDMHDVLWKAYAQQLERRALSPQWWRKRAVRLYARAEEASWPKFDALIAINHDEYEYASARVPSGRRLFYAPMGTDLSRWPYSWNPATPPRLAYYGGLGSRRNADDALRCVRGVMPIVWRSNPRAEIWLIGSDPPGSLRALQADPRVKVTGFVDNPAETLRSLICMLCPWKGAYGFRSRLVEAMAVGVPVVASPDASAGMELVQGRGILFGETDSELAAHAVTLLSDPAYARDQSRSARAQVEGKYNLTSTYGRLVAEMEAWLRERARAQP